MDDQMYPIEDLPAEGEAIESTMGAKQLGDKIPVQLLPVLPMMEIARVLQFGAQKYDDWNWIKGIPLMTCVGSCLRHLYKFMMGEDNDDESGLPHLAHAGCNILFALQFFKTRKAELDDRCTHQKNGFNDVSPIDQKKWDAYANVMNLDK